MKILKPHLFVFILLTTVTAALQPAAAQEPTIDPENDNPYTIAGEVAGATCDADKAYQYLEQFKASPNIIIRPQIGGSPGINPAFACRLAAYFKAVQALGCRPKITSGYRSSQTQLQTCLRICGKPYCPGKCAPAGRSCHQYGAAVDVVGASRGKGCPQATGALAAKYGLIFGYSSNPKVPADNRKKGRNHFQCIENKTSGASSCAKQACGPGTPPPYDPNDWDPNSFSDDPGPEFHDLFEQYDQQLPPMNTPPTTPPTPPSNTGTMPSLSDIASQGYEPTANTYDGMDTFNTEDSSWEELYQQWLSVNTSTETTVSTSDFDSAFDQEQRYTDTETSDLDTFVTDDEMPASEQVSTVSAPENPKTRAVQKELLKAYLSGELPRTAANTHLVYTMLNGTPQEQHRAMRQLAQDLITIRKNAADTSTTQTNESRSFSFFSFTNTWTKTPWEQQFQRRNSNTLEDRLLLESFLFEEETVQYPSWWSSLWLRLKYWWHNTFSQ